jgi:hypothetical protein
VCETSRVLERFGEETAAKVYLTSLAFLSLLSKAGKAVCVSAEPNAKR